MTAFLKLLRGSRPLIARFRADRRGAALIELGLAMPVALVIMLGGFDTARYIMLHQKLDRAVATVADLVARPSQLTAAQVDALFPASVDIVAPFDLPGRGRVIISSVSRSNGPQSTVDWQRSGGGSLGVTSRIGSPGGNAALPSGLTLRDGENAIVAEVYYDYEPFFLHYGLDPGIQGHTAVRRPRRADLSQLN